MPPQKNNRKHDILDAVQECVRVHGIRRFTMSDIAREAGVSRQTLYDNFSDKESLMKGFLKRLLRLVRFAAHRQIRQAQDKKHGLARGFYLFFQYTLSRPLMQNLAVRREFLDFVWEHIRTLNDQGTTAVARLLRTHFGIGRIAARLAGEHAFRMLASYVLLPADRIDRRTMSRTIAISVLAIAEYETQT